MDECQVASLHIYCLSFFWDLLKPQCVLTPIAKPWCSCWLTICCLITVVLSTHVLSKAVFKWQGDVELTALPLHPLALSTAGASGDIQVSGHHKDGSCPKSPYTCYWACRACIQTVSSLLSCSVFCVWWLQLPLCARLLWSRSAAGVLAVLFKKWR